MSPSAFQGSTTVRSRSVISNDRLDASYFNDSSVAAAERLAILEASGVEVHPLADLADVWDPARFARVWASKSEEGLPYLRPYDVFDYLPTEKQRLSVAKNRDVSSLQISSTSLLQTCSGRNLGPCVAADNFLAEFALSHDMIRIDAREPDDRFYILAFLKSSLGQALLRRSRSGSVIDHITTSDVSRVPIPYLETGDRDTVADLMREAVQLTEEARISLNTLLNKYNSRFGVRSETSSKSWTIRASTIRGRLDAAFYEPSVTAAREALRTNGGRLVGDAAVTSLPVRYKRYYVSEGHGRPIVSGRQLLQPSPINLQWVSDRSFRDSESYVIREGMVIFGADGRAEGRQGTPALVTSDRDGWLASNHVMRLTARASTSPGELWLALSCDATQTQIKALSFGSVVDQVNPGDVENCYLPAIDSLDGVEAQAAWNKFAKAQKRTNEAVALLDKKLM